jgi:hypothetical protein
MFLKQVKKIWNQISYSGITQSMPEDLRLKIIICNRTGVIAFFVAFKSLVLYLGSPHLFTIATFLALVYLSVIFINYLGFYNLSRVIMVFTPAVALLVLTGYMTDGPAFSSRSQMMVNILCPLLLYQMSEPLKMFAGIAWIILLYCLYDPVTAAIPRHFEVDSDTKFNNAWNTTFTGVIVLVVIVIAFLLLQKINESQVKIWQLKWQHKDEETALLLKRTNMLEHEIETTRNKQDNLVVLNKSLQSQALRAQMDPHFMFNALNSIQNFIISKETKAALGYVSKFSKLMRQTLESSMKEQVTVEEELDMLKNYLDLEQLRFDKAFEYHFEIDESIDIANTEIPSMLLQPYIENAILHGLRHKNGGGSLKITLLNQFEYLLCVIEDNGIGRERSAIINAERHKHRSAGIHVTNTRLSLLQLDKGDAAKVVFLDLKDAAGQSAGTRVEIKIPYEF